MKKSLLSILIIFSMLQSVFADKTNTKDISSENSFENSIFYVGVIFGMGILGGKLNNKEENLYNRYKDSDSQNYNAYPRDKFDGGLETDVIIPVLFGKTMLGIKGRFLFSEGSQLDDHTVFQYKNIQLGPLIKTIVDDPKAYRVLLFQYYGLYGRIYDGNLRAIAALRSKGIVVMDKSQYETTFTGHTINLGVGVQLVFNTSTPFVLGAGLNYTYAKL